MYYVELHKSHLEYLAPIRHWDNLKLAFDGETLFLKDFSHEQINASVLLQNPHILVYELREQLLFRLGKLVPTKKLPSALLWMPILNALPIDLPKFNNNYFGIQEKIEIQIIASEIEEKPFALLVKLAEVKGYIETLPQIRMQALKWVIIEDSILFIGSPLLPIKGKTYWKRDNALFPTGYALEFDILFPILQKQLNPNNDNLLLFQNNSSYLVIPLTDFKPLTLSSFRLTVTN